MSPDGTEPAFAQPLLGVGVPSRGASERGDDELTAAWDHVLRLETGSLHVGAASCGRRTAVIGGSRVG
jgi:hypothetical protein